LAGRSLPLNGAEDSTSARSTGAPEHDWAWKLAIIVVFAVTLGLLMTRHEMWRDELQAWMLARDSGSLTDLWRNTRWEGHPLLWHALLMPLAHLFHHPVSMQILHWVTAVLTTAVFVVRAPFSLPWRAAMVFGYLPLYEYGVISRNYALTMLGLWLFCTLAGRRRSAIWPALGASIAVNASPMGTILFPALAMALFSRRSLRHRLIAILIVAAAAFLAIAQELPAVDYEHARGWNLGWNGFVAVYVVRGFAGALLPIPPANIHFWNDFAFFPFPPPAGPKGFALIAIATVVVGGVVLGTGWLLRRHPWFMLSWLGGASALILFSYVKFPGALRHHGFLWVFWVTTLWWAVDTGALTRKRATALLTPTIVAGLIGAVIAGWWDWREPFSAAKSVSEQISDRGLAGLPLIGGCDFAASGVAAFLPDGRLYYPVKNGEGSYVIWNLSRLRQNRLTDRDLVHATLVRDRGQGAVLIVNRPLKSPELDLCRQVAACAPTIVSDESLWAYHCPAAPRTGSPE